jgi:hypothetical protein
MEPLIVFFGVSHLLIWLLLLGEGMAARYEHSEATAERWGFQEESLVLMRRAVKSAGTTLPFLILYALAPQPEALQILVLVLGVAGVAALLRGRTFGVLALGAAGVVAMADGLGFLGAPVTSYLLLTPTGSLMIYGPVASLLAGGLLLVPLAFARPMLRYLRAR